MFLRRWRLRYIYYFIFITIIISKMSQISSHKSLNNDKLFLNLIDNVITKNVDDTNLFTTISPNKMIHESKDIMMSTIKSEIKKFTTESTLESTTTTIFNDKSHTVNYSNNKNISMGRQDENSNNSLNNFEGTIITSETPSVDNITVEEFNIVNSTDTTVTVEWKPPKYDNNIIDVKEYFLEWSKDENSIESCNVSNVTRIYTFEGLDLCTNYKISVRPCIDDQLGGKKVVIGKTILTVNEDTLKLKIERGEYSLKATWSVPNTDCLTGYNVTYCEQFNCKSVDINVTYHNATQLMPCTEYKFTVAVHDESVNFGNNSKIVSTLSKETGPPKDVWTLAGIDYLNILWIPPNDVSCVANYRVTITNSNSSQTNSTNNTNLLFTKLQPCEIYEVNVIAVDKKDNDSHPKIIQSNRTLALVPQSPSMKLWNSTNNTIMLNWKLGINHTNNCSNIEIKTECMVIKTLGDGYKGSNGTSNVNVTKDNGELMIRGLSPYTNYTCQSIALNSQGISDKSTPLIVLTSDDVSSPPFADVFDMTHKNFTIKWEKPVYLPGKLHLFEVVFSWYYRYHRPIWCKKKPAITETISNIPGNIFSHTFNNIKPFVTYSVKVRASTGAGWSVLSENVGVNTLPGAPGPISNAEFFIKESSDNGNIMKPILKWGRPCLMNDDDIKYFNVTAIGKRRGFPIHQFTDNIDGGAKDCINDTCVYTFKNNQLNEEYNYTFIIAGIVSIGSTPELGEVTEIVGVYPAGIPPEPDLNYTKQITINPYKIRRTTTTANIILPVFSNKLGEIRCYAVIVSKAGYSNANSSRLNLIDGEWPDIASWYESMNVDFQIPYQATKLCDMSNPSYIIDYGKFKVVKVVIGDDTECGELSSKYDERSYCNGPLKPDMLYDVRMRAFTNGGYRDSTIFTIKTNAELQVGVIIGTIFGILSLGVLITTMLLVRKCSIHALLRRFLHSDMPGSPVPTPFNRRKFIAHCQELADNPGKLSNEFQLLQTLSVDLQMPTNAACLQANRKKNRYTDILPYDFSRVKLESIDNDPNSDYINASFIKGCNGEEEYIACQGPKEETTYDFWRMIDQYDVKLIVMLTQLTEKNKDKCHQYYPTIRETFTYENMSIRCSSELDYRTYTQRTLILQKEDEKRTILHLHFKDWPDHDVPEDFDPMINFCQIMRRHIVANRGLAVIHCSAGIGRTGTLIAIDILLQHIKENRKLDVFGTVYRLRHHRINMVQRESQYAYIYNCIRQVLKNPYFSKSYKPPSVDPITDNNSNKMKTNSMTNLVSSLETLRKSRLSTSSIESIEQIYNSSTLRSSTSSKSDDNCLLLHGLQFSKSTSAICSKPHHSEIVRYNTVDFSIYQFKNDIEDKSSSCSLEDDAKLDDSISSMYENFQQLNNIQLTNIIDHDPLINQKLLDTSV